MDSIASIYLIEMKNNTPFNPKEHMDALKAAVPGLRKVPANAWGDSGSNAHWHEVDMPESSVPAFAEHVKKNNFYAGEDSAYPGRRCFKLCRYVSET